MTETPQEAAQAEPTEADQKDTELEDVVELVQGALDKMGLDVQVDGRLDGRYVRLNVSGDDAEALVSGNGAAASSHVLDALQLVIMRRQVGDSARSVVIDAGGFREERLDQLEAASKRLGDHAAEGGDPIRVWGMNSFDRRAIHLALKERKDVRSDSEGEGVFRVLVVSPSGKKKKDSKDDDES